MKLYYAFHVSLGAGAGANETGLEIKSSKKKITPNFFLSLVISQK